MDREREQYDEDNAPSYLAQHTVLPANWSYLKPFHNRAHSINFLVPAPYHAMNMKLNCTANNEQQRQCDRNMNSSNVLNSNHQTYNSNMPYISQTCMDLDLHSVMATELLEEAKDSGMSDSSGGGSAYCERPALSKQSASFIDAKNEEVLRRVQEMQKMVENSEQYLSEQVEHDYQLQRKTSGSSSFSGNNSWPHDGNQMSNALTANSGVIEFDSDCDSLNSSKVSSNDETSQQAGLKHSDSLVLLAESINQDLSGITKSLNSIGTENQESKPSLSKTTSPRPARKLNGFGQLLSNLQALGTDYSQSESDSESINSPINSPTTRRPSLLNTDERSQRKQNLAYRSSFGLHSPDGNNFGAETKDYNLKEYLKQLKEISNVDNCNQDTDLAAKKLTEIYGFEIRGDTFIKTDSDLIDLRAIPPPQTPDELDALSLLNAVPQGFDDGGVANKKTEATEADLDNFLAKVVVAPPTQKATPAKELTPEEIMSFIIPPPPNLEQIEKQQQETEEEKLAEQSECLYSNSLRECQAMQNGAGKHQAQPVHVIEYATVERKSKFSCCPKSKKEESEQSDSASNENDAEALRLPPRSNQGNQPAPMRPPKSAELMQRFSPKKQMTICSSSPTSEFGMQPRCREATPPQLPPRPSPSSQMANRSFEEKPMNCATVSLSVPPKKPPLPPLTTRPIPRGVLVPTPSSNIMPLPPPRMPSNALSTHESPTQQQQQLATPPPAPPRSPHSNGHHRSNSDCPPVCLKSPVPESRPQLSLLCSPQMPRKLSTPLSPQLSNKRNQTLTGSSGERLIIKNGRVIDGEALLAKTDVAMAGLLVKLDQVAAQCTQAQAAGGGSSIDEDKFQKARNELTDQTLILVTASKYLVVAMSDLTLSTLPEHLTSCLTAIRRITELTQDMTRHTSSPLQTRNIVLKVHDVASSFKELVGVQIGPLGAGQLALQAECLANVLATLLRSLRVFSP